MHTEEWDTLNLKRKYIFILSTAYVQYNLSRVYIMGEREGGRERRLQFINSTTNASNIISIYLYRKK